MAVPQFAARKKGRQRKKKAWPYWVLGLFVLWVAAGIWTSIKPGPDPRIAAVASLASAGDAGSALSAQAAEAAVSEPDALQAERAASLEGSAPASPHDAPPAEDTLMMFYATPAPTVQPTSTPILTLLASSATRQTQEVRYGKTAASGVNLRAEPTTGSTALRINRIDTPVTVLAATFNSIGEEWYKVHYGEFEGYIRCDLVILIPQGEFETLVSLVSH